MNVQWLGRVGYAAAAELQEQLRRQILDGDEAAERLLLLEHDPVLTLGRSAARTDILADESTLAALGVTVQQSTRGGQVTYHGPGQLVAYAVMRLRRGVVEHVTALCDAAIEVARLHGIDARFRRDCPGVWVGDSKLAALGVHVHRRVATHGIALNVTTALDAYDLIVPCGMRGGKTTSLAALGARVESAEAVAGSFARAFLRLQSSLPTVQ